MMQMPEAGKREDEILLVGDLIRAELLMPFANKIIPAVVKQYVRSEYGFRIAYRDARFENVVRGFDIAVTVVNADDDFVLEILHFLIPPSWISIRFVR